MRLKLKIIIGISCLVLLGVVCIIVFTTYRGAAEHRQEIAKIGAEWQQLGRMSQDDYTEMRRIGDAVVRDRSLPDKDVNWLVAELKGSNNVSVHMRVLTMLGTLADPPPAQKKVISDAIQPILLSQNSYEKQSAIRARDKLRLGQ